MTGGKYTILFERVDGRYKICKVWFGKDGSYYVSVPYHPAKKAFLCKQTMNYDTSVVYTIDGGDFLPISEALDVASSDNKRIKLSHHPDGFIQFSGSGVISGKRPDGIIKGMGIQSWRLLQGCRDRLSVLRSLVLSNLSRKTRLATKNACLMKKNCL